MTVDDDLARQETVAHVQEKCVHAQVSIQRIRTGAQFALSERSESKGEVAERLEAAVY